MPIEWLNFDVLLPGITEQGVSPAQPCPIFGTDFIPDPCYWVGSEGGASYVGGLLIATFPENTAFIKVWALGTSFYLSSEPTSVWTPSPGISIKISESDGSVIYSRTVSGNEDEPNARSTSIDTIVDGDDSILRRVSRGGSVSISLDSYFPTVIPEGADITSQSALAISACAICYPSTPPAPVYRLESAICSTAEST